MPDTQASNLPAHTIGPNDLLAISIYDAPELSRTVRVSPEGDIRIPMLQSTIRAEGALPAEMETRIADALRSEEILVSPVVTVTVAEYNSRPITVAGAVKNPLTFQAIGPMRLLDAIGKAGGLTDTAGSEILVLRPSGATQISVRALINAQDAELNIPLSGGEEIRVPTAGRVFVAGNVRKPGAFAIRDAAEGTVLQMLAMAEGLTPFAQKRAYIYRRTPEGARTEVVVELEEVLKRKSTDVAVLPEDILYIPDNKSRRMSMAALERILHFGSTAGATALIYNGVR
jgi:polysaccharide export outer membrane protein